MVVLYFFHMEGSFTETAVVVGIVNFKWCMVYGGHMKLAGQALSPYYSALPCESYQLYTIIFRGTKSAPREPNQDPP
jgi:hypothetical protein